MLISGNFNKTDLSINNWLVVAAAILIFAVAFVLFAFNHFEAKIFNVLFLSIPIFVAFTLSFMNIYTLIGFVIFFVSIWVAYWRGKADEYEEENRNG